MRLNISMLLLHVMRRNRYWYVQHQRVVLHIMGAVSVLAFLLSCRDLGSLKTHFDGPVQNTLQLGGHLVRGCMAWLNSELCSSHCRRQQCP